MFPDTCSPDSLTAQSVLTDFIEHLKLLSSCPGNSVIVAEQARSELWRLCSAATTKRPLRRSSTSRGTQHSTCRSPRILLTTAAWPRTSNPHGHRVDRDLPAAVRLAAATAKKPTAPGTIRNSHSCHRFRRISASNSPRRLFSVQPHLRS